jgi:separase
MMDIGLSSLAECACLALSSLRDLRSSGAESDKQFNVQLEQGLCVLIGKLLAIGLSDLAIRELRRLKERIQARIGKGGRKRVKIKGTQEEKDEPLEELIQTGPIPATSNCHQLLISFNAHVLRTVEVERNPSTVNRLPAALVISNPSSPVNLILAAYEQGVITEEKATLQLQSVSHSILQIAGAAPNPRESAQSSSRIRIKPTVTLSLQLLSLEVKSILWKISGHKFDEPKELWEPLARYVANFARRSGTFREVEYDCVKEAFHRFESTIRTNGYEVRNASQGSSLSTVFRRLGQFAHTAGRVDDAVKSYAMAIKLLPADQHLQLALCSCKAALLSIESMPKHPMSKGISAIKKAAVSLTAPLRGTQSDMEELIIESARLKKGAMQLISRLVEGQSASEPVAKDVGMFRLSTAKFLANFVRLLNRYLLPTTPGKRDTDAAEPCDRLGKFRNVASAAVDSGISMGKLSITTGQPPWPEIEELLSDCLRLLIGTEKDEGPLSEPALPNSKSGLARFSNLYWSLYTCEKDRGKPPDELVRHLERSVGILRKVSSQEQASGFMALKLERLAGLYSDIGENSKSDAAYVKSIRAHFDAGALDAVVDDFTKRHPLHIWRDSKSPAFHLGRVLNSFVRSRIQRSLKCVYFDDENLDQEWRAILLERQMFALTGLQQRATDVSPHFSSLLSSLLSLYPTDTYPVRRMRVVLMSLRFILDGENHVENEIRHIAVAEAQKLLAQDFELVSDSGLAHLRPYTESVLRLALGFILGKTHVDTVSLAVGSWVSILQNSNDWESLEAKVDDISLWMSQANAVADYLDSQGLWKLRTHTLAVIRQVLERQPQPASTELVSCLSQIGLQYSRLGYPEPAHICLSQAEELVQLGDVPHVVLLKWYLAYAEHLLDTAEIDKW